MCRRSIRMARFLPDVLSKPMAKLAKPHSGWLTRPQTQKLLDVLNDDTAVTRCVGGCVRDTLMACADADTEVDMASDLTPQEVMARCKAAHIKIVPTGIKHGTVSAILYEGRQSLVYEITTLRVDIDTDGRHAKVAFTQDWQGDAARRDFTINALYVDADGTLHDPTGQGLDDIEAGKVRFIGDVAARLEEDYLRVLRYFRFHYRLTPDVAPEADVVAACRAAREDLQLLSGERRQMEMLKIMALPHAYEALCAMQQADILPAILNIDLVHFAPLKIMSGLSDDPFLRLMVILPRVDDGRMIAQSLKLSKKQTKRMVLALENWHEQRIDTDNLTAALYFDGVEAVTDYALLSLATNGGDKALLEAALDEAARFIRPTFPLTGAMMKSAGIEKGPDMGAMAEALEIWWVDAGFPDKAAVEKELRKRVSLTAK